MKPGPLRFAVLPAATLALGACVSQGPFPSLAPRPGEQVAIEEPVREIPAAADDPALRSAIAGLLEAARDGGRSFDADLAATQAAVARAGAEGSESWVEAQQAISRLESARNRTTQAVDDLHRLSLSRADRPTSPADQQAIDSAIAAAEGIAAEQQARIDRIRR